MSNLGTLGGNYSVANSINNNGQIVGVASTANGSQRAFLYSDQSSLMTRIDSCFCILWTKPVRRPTGKFTPGAS